MLFYIVLLKCRLSLKVFYLCSFCSDYVLISLVSSEFALYVFGLFCLVVFYCVLFVVQSHDVMCFQYWKGVRFFYSVIVRFYCCLVHYVIVNIANIVGFCFKVYCVRVSFHIQWFVYFRIVIFFFHFNIIVSLQLQMCDVCSMFF